jgi:hypothetical protein
MVSFERESQDPFAMLALRYDGAEGARALAERRGAPVRTTALVRQGGLEVSLRDEGGSLLPAWRAGGQVIAIGEIGRRYTLRVSNQTPGRVEAVASVDGLDVLDGRSASPAKRGYLIAPWSTLQIDGFRKSQEEVAAFRFGATDQSYASRTGHPRDVGVIGVAFFDERGSRRRRPYDPAELDRRESADPFPGRWAAPPPR